MTDDDVIRLLAQLEADIERLAAGPATPWPEIWPCDTCGNPGVRNVAAKGYCAHHLHVLYATFGPEAWVDGGVGLQSGRACPEYGPLEYELTCCCCGATWTGIPGDACHWCRRAIEIQIDHQIDLLLTPPDVDPDDITFDAKIEAWAERLARGIKSGLITKQQAEAAARSADRRVA